VAGRTISRATSYGSVVGVARLSPDPQGVRLHFELDPAGLGAAVPHPWSGPQVMSKGSLTLDVTAGVVELDTRRV
jgi:hypothetical protein